MRLLLLLLLSCYCWALPQPAPVAATLTLLTQNSTGLSMPSRPLVKLTRSR
jgi:hypothetical protein